MRVSIDDEDDYGTLVVQIGRDDSVTLGGYGTEMTLRLPLYAHEAQDIIDVLTPIAKAGQDRTHLLRQYRVSLKEDKGDKFTIMFDCQAEDDDHAEEQAMNAYPDGAVVNITRLCEEKNDEPEYMLVMTSEEYGREEFGPYADMDAALQGQRKILESAEAMNDGVRRSFEIIASEKPNDEEGGIQ